MRIAAAVLLCLVSLGTAADLGLGLSLLNRGQLNGAYRELKEAAEGGDIVAARALGSLLERGMKVQGGQTLEPRPEEAVRWYRKAAEGGDKHSIDMLGVLYSGGLGVPRDAAESLRWFAKTGRVPAADEYAGLPEADRAEVAAWVRAVGVTLWRDMRFPRGAAQRNAYGKVKLEYDAASNAVRIAESNAIELIRNQTEVVARRALLSAPPPPAAVRHGIKTTQEVEFTITSD